jgi:acetyltransferase-like isoleucine patch superfamily enzyme
MPEIPRAQDQLFSEGRSPREKYSSLVVGRPGWGALLQYELVQLLSQYVPGALGLALRRALFPLLLGGCGRNVIFGQNVVLRHPHKIRIADNVVIDDNCLIDAKGDTNKGITIGSEVFSASRVTIGRQTLLAAYCYVIGGDHDFSDPSIPVIAQGRRSKGVTIGEGVWLGAGAKILDGVSIGDRAIVGAGAVVRETVPDGAIAVGIPARVVGQRDQAVGA